MPAPHRDALATSQNHFLNIYGKPFRKSIDQEKTL